MRRAYARQLRITVAWTALATQPIQARTFSDPFGRAVSGSCPREDNSCNEHLIHLWIIPQVVLDTVEVVLALNQGDSLEDGAHKLARFLPLCFFSRFVNCHCTTTLSDGRFETALLQADQEDAAGSGWLGSFTSLLLHTLFNVSIKVNNVVVKYLAPTSVATLTCQSFHISTATDAWQTQVRVCPLLLISFGLFS